MERAASTPPPPRTGRREELPGRLPRRFRSLPLVEVGGLWVPLARGVRARALGLARLERADAGPGLLIPRCSSVHTFGMRFELCVLFLDADGEVLRRIDALPPRRFAGCRGADSVLELPAGGESFPGWGVDHL
ncbi:MAG TPA: DUF192 domain-containing protein [Solirubrobacterales bacterium]|nr:DUF192 domain-containing protein [Solirubrobacterales bacterium]